MKEKIINYFFDEEEKEELVPKYEFLVKLAIVSLITTLLINLL